MSAVCVEEIVKKQVTAGINVVCERELSKIFYVRHRLSGIGMFRDGENEKPPKTAACLERARCRL